MNNTPTISFEGGRIECHPLFNSAVLDNLVGWLDVSSLKEMRGVCKDWHRKASPRLQSLAWVKLRSVDASNLDQFIHYIETVPREQVFFRNYEIDTCNFHSGNQFVKTFLQCCSPTLVSLDLKYTHLTREFLQKLMFCWTPELKHLSFEDCLFDSESVTTRDKKIRMDEFICNKLNSLRFRFTRMLKSMADGDDEDIPHRSHVLPFKWTEIFKAFPNLKLLAMNDLTDEENLELLLALRKFSQSASGLQLEHLDVFGHMRVSMRIIPYKEWDLLSQLRLPTLRTLVIDIGLWVDERGFQKVLANFAPNLHKLQIWRGRMGNHLCGFPYDIKFPRLKILEIPENCVNELRFVNYMRGLESLSITQCDTHPNAEPTKIFSEINTTKIQPLLTLTYILVEFYLSDVSDVERLFPNILRILMVGKSISDSPELGATSTDSWSDDDDDEGDRDHDHNKIPYPEWLTYDDDKESGSDLEFGVDCKDM